MALALRAASVAGIVLLAIAGLAVATAATGRGPGYVPFGIDTRGGGRAAAAGLITHTEGRNR